MAKVNSKTVLGIVGGAVSAAVGGLIVWLNVSGKEEVPRFARPIAGKPSVYVCKGAPGWVDKELTKALAWWKDHGAEVGAVIKGVDCPPDCTIAGRDGMPRAVSCHDGAITIDLMTTRYDDTHGGETLWVKSGARLAWATIELPTRVEPPVLHDDDGMMVIPDLPPDVNALVLTHELGHAFGYDHSVTRIAGGLVAHKTGEVMNPNVQDLGFGDKGLP